MNLDYFKNTNLQILFNSLKEKYYKTSKLTGTVKINPKTKEEVTEIEKLIRNGKYLKQNEINIIKIIDIRKGIEKTKFYNYSLEDIIKYIYGDITPKKTIDELQKQLNIQKYNSFLDKYKNTPVIDLLCFIPISEVIHNLNKDYILFDNVCKAVLSLPDIPTLLSVFSTNVTKDPHYFDLETKASNMLIKYLAIEQNIEIPKSRVQKINLLKINNIITDAHSNFVITYNLWGEDYLDILSSRNETTILNTSNIMNINSVMSKNKKILIFENPSILDYVTKLKTEYGIIIGGGNPNAALYNLLDKFKDHEFLYNGDYDPEGLLIADKLSKKYTNLKLILYTSDLFIKAKSDKEISSTRIKMLDNIDNKSLLEVVSLIKKTKSVGYQEKIIDDIIYFIKNG